MNKIIIILCLICVVGLCWYNGSISQANDNKDILKDVITIELESNIPVKIIGIKIEGEKHKGCPVCSSEEHIKLYVLGWDDPDVNITQNNELRICLNCGNVYVKLEDWK